MRSIGRNVGMTAMALALATAPATLRAQVAIDSDDIGGVVRGPGGPEAGVWVIAETTDLPTKFARIVVTDDQGRYVIPDLPKAKYKVWVRGYGLVDSPKVDGEPGKIAQPDRGRGAERGGGGAVLSGDLLVLDDEDSRGQPIRRQEQDPRQNHARSIGSPRSRTATASAAISSASCPRAPSRPRSASSSRGRKHGSVACSRDSLPRTW